MTAADLLDHGHQAMPQVYDRATPAEREALTLLAVIHDGMDWDTWGGIRYWAQLTERAQLARIAGPRITDWWGDITRRMNIDVTAPNRALVAPILAAPDPGTLTALADRTEWVVTLLRLAVDTRKTTRAAHKQQEELPL